MDILNFDNQLLSDFAKCEAAGIARHVLGLRSRKEKIAADIGNAYHKAMELHFAGKQKRWVVDRFLKAYDTIIPPEQQPEEDRFARNNCIKILERFCDVRSIEKFPFEAVEFERTIGFEIAPGYVFWGKRDMKVRERSTGQIAVVDHKSTRRITDWFARKHRLTSQLSGYIWLIEQETGQAVTTAYINAIEVAKLPDLNRRCAVHGKKYIECSAEHANFQLFQYHRTPEQIARWRNDALIIAKRFQVMKQAYASVELLPLAHCNGAFNEECMFCEYAEWCAGGFEPTRWGEFCVFEPWSPWLEAKKD